jgi:hypothetical protein
MPRCVLMYSRDGSASRSLARRVLMWVSTVRSVLSLSSPQAAASRASREWMRPAPRQQAGQQAVFAPRQRQRLAVQADALAHRSS